MQGITILEGVTGLYGQLEGKIAVIQQGSKNILLTQLIH